MTELDGNSARVYFIVVKDATHTFLGWKVVVMIYNSNVKLKLKCIVIVVVVVFMVELLYIV